MLCMHIDYNMFSMLKLVNYSSGCLACAQAVGNHYAHSLSNSLHCKLHFYQSYEYVFLLRGPG